MCAALWIATASTQGRARADTRFGGFGVKSSVFRSQGVPIGSILVPCCGLYLGSYNKVSPKRNYYGACGV